MVNFWDLSAGFYDLAGLTRRSVDKQTVGAVKEIVNGGRVLDAAAGTGMFSIAAAEKAAHVTCTDLSEKMLLQSMAAAKKKGITNISFARRNIISLEDYDETYDYVIAGNVIHLLDTPEEAVDELLRVCKKGGKVIIPTYLNSMSGGYKILLSIFKLFGFRTSKSFDLDSYMSFIRRCAEKNGCTEYSTRIIYGSPLSGFAVITKG